MIRLLYTGSLQQQMGFGKHKFMLVQEVLKYDPGYIIWMAKNPDSFFVSKPLYKAAIMSLKRISNKEYCKDTYPLY